MYGTTARVILTIALLAVVDPVSRTQATQYGQQNVPQPSHPNLPTTPDDTRMDGDMRARMEAQRARFATDERRKKLVEDTARLLALSTELKAEVDKTTKDELSLDVVRKAGEIEKLAHDVKERMKN